MRWNSPIDTQAAPACCRPAGWGQPVNRIWIDILKPFNRYFHAIWLLAVSCLLPAAVPAGSDYERLVIFDDSLSDSGNAYDLTGMALKPPYTALIPDYPYARRRHHLSNGTTWVEWLAKKMKLQKSAGPALVVPGNHPTRTGDKLVAEEAASVLGFSK